LASRWDLAHNTRGGVLFAVGEMMGWAVLERDLAVALGVLAVAIALTLCFLPAAPAPDDDAR